MNSRRRRIEQALNNLNTNDMAQSKKHFNDLNVVERMQRHGYTHKDIIQAVTQVLNRHYSRTHDTSRYHKYLKTLKSI